MHPGEQAGAAAFHHQLDRPGEPLHLPLHPLEQAQLMGGIVPAVGQLVLLPLQLLHLLLPALIFQLQAGEHVLARLQLFLILFQLGSVCGAQARLLLLLGQELVQLLLHRLLPLRQLPQGGGERALLPLQLSQPLAPCIPGPAQGGQLIAQAPVGLLHLLPALVELPLFLHQLLQLPFQAALLLLAAVQLV